MIQRQQVVELCNGQGIESLALDGVLQWPRAIRLELSRHMANEMSIDI